MTNENKLTSTHKSTSTTQSRCGYVAIVGRPNTGKSTLLNCILNKKVSITTEKPQTTRHQILGIKTQAEDQAVYIDTPGIHTDEKRAMNRYLNRLANAVIPDADVIVFMVEALHWEKDDELVLNKLQNTQAPVILVINKIDKIKDKSKLLPFMDKIKNKYSFYQIFPLSALSAVHVKDLEKEIMKLLPANPHFFPDDQYTDKNEKFQMAEIIREKVIKATEQEIPYSSTVEIEKIDQKQKVKTSIPYLEINAIIWVERDGQKVIIIGRDGERLKKIGSQARKEIENIVQQKVFLRLWVKVKPGWTDSERAITSLGYE